jgi:hypothetical protein
MNARRLIRLFQYLPDILLVLLRESVSLNDEGLLFLTMLLRGLVLMRFESGEDFAAGREGMVSGARRV